MGSLLVQYDRVLIKRGKRQRHTRGEHQHHVMVEQRLKCCSCKHGNAVMKGLVCHDKEVGFNFPDQCSSNLSV